MHAAPLAAHLAPNDAIRIGLVVPMQGPTGIYGPSCLACAELAVEQLNRGDGIAGRRVELVIVDAGRDPDTVALEVAWLVESGRVDALAGWHISAVRRAITRRVGGRVVYAYAAMHEGRDDTPGVFMLGERPVNQLLPAGRWMREQFGVRRWAVVGNDYVFPRVTAAAAREAMRGSPSSIVRETFVPLGTRDFRMVLSDLRRPGVDGVMMLLMGQDAVHFNRQFARAGLSELLVRLSPAVEENTLLGGGASANRRLFAAAAYFDGMGTTEGGAFEQAYRARYGPFAPPLNAVGESCYEAIHFLATIARSCGGVDVAAVESIRDGYFYEGPRGLMRLDGNLLNQDVYVAAADGLGFTVQERIARTS